MILQWNALAQETALAYPNVFFVPTFDLFHGRPDRLAADRFHPNARRATPRSRPGSCSRPRETEGGRRRYKKRRSSRTPRPMPRRSDAAEAIRLVFAASEFLPKSFQPAAAAAATPDAAQPANRQRVRKDTRSTRDPGPPGEIFALEGGATAQLVEALVLVRRLIPHPPDNVLPDSPPVRRWAAAPSGPGPDRLRPPGSPPRAPTTRAARSSRGAAPEEAAGNSSGCTRVSHLPRQTPQTPRPRRRGSTRRGCPAPDCRTTV